MKKFLERFSNKTLVKKYSGITENKDNSQDYMANFIKTKATTILRAKAEESKNDFEVSSWEAYKAAKTLSENKPVDKGLKYIAFELKKVWEENNGNYIKISSLAPIGERVSRMFSGSSANKFLIKDIITLSPQAKLDTKFLCKVASLIDKQEEFDKNISELGYSLNRPDCISARNYLKAKINERLGNEIIKDSFINSIESPIYRSSAIDSLNKVINTNWNELKTVEKVYDTINNKLIAKKDIKIRAFDFNDDITQSEWLNSQINQGFETYLVETESQDEVILASTNMMQQEAEDSLYEKIGSSVKLVAVAPHGWEETIKKMKKHIELDNPWALAWYEKGKGYSASKKEAKEWKIKLPLSFITEIDSPSDEDVQDLGKLTAEVLRQYKDKLKKIGFNDVDNFITEFLEVTDADEFDYVLNDLYDVGDSLGIWIETQDTEDTTAKKANPIEDNINIKDLEYKHELKKPTPIKTPPTIETLKGQAKEALTKIYNRTREIRELKDNISSLNARLKEEELIARPEVSGYLKMAEEAFRKANMVLNTTYALETKEEVIMAAVYHSPIREIPEEGQTVYSKDAETILALLKAAGKITDEMVSEIERTIDSLNEGVRYIKEVTRKVQTWPPSQKDIKNIIRTEGQKIAGIIDWVKDAWAGLKKFIGLANKYEDTIGQVIEIAEVDN